MFSKRRSFWRGKWYFLLIVGLLGLGYWFNEGFTKEKTNLGPDTSTAVRQPSSNGTIEKDKTREEKENSERFYKIIEENGLIKIYYCDDSGRQDFVKNTEISFSMLSETDQDLFRKGVIIKSKEELDELLQDFES